MGVDQQEGVEQAQEPAAGDLVAWIAKGGITTGRVIRVLTAPERVGEPGVLGRRIRASEDAPFFLVEPELGGAHEAHRRESLTLL
jgi:hypothetical protein